MVKGKNVISLHALGMFSLLVFMQRGEATTFTVGGSGGWSVPSDNSPVFNQWAEKMRFQIGDSLLFVYAPGSDSVLQVTKEDYTNCATTSPIAKFSDGHTEFKFNSSGPYYFISGNKDNCLKNEKLVVVVLADRSGGKNTTVTAQSPPSPPPSTTTSATPAPAPATSSAGTGEGTTPAPSTESDHPPNNGVGSIVMSFVGLVGAFVGYSSLLLVA